MYFEKLSTYKVDKDTKELEEAFLRFSDMTSLEENSVLDAQHLVDVEISFFEAERYKGNVKIVTLKVGNKKMYKVQNIGRFLTDFAEKHFERYGKELSFLHKIDNLNEKSKKIISLLTKH